MQMASKHQRDANAAHTPNEHIQAFSLIVASSHCVHHMMMLESDALFSSTNFFALFALENWKETKKKVSVDDQHQPNGFHIHAPTRPLTCEFFSWSFAPTRSNITQLSTNTAVIMHIDCNCKRFPMLPSTSSAWSHVCGSLLVLSDVAILLHAADDAAAYQTRRKIAELKSFIRILCVFRSHGASNAMCWMCLWLWNDREYAEGNDPHFFGTHIAVPDSSICLLLILIIRLLLIAFYKKKKT